MSNVVEKNWAGASVAAVMQTLDGQLAWVACPWCGESWSKLKTCWFFEATKRKCAEICAECAETVRGLPYVQAEFALPNVLVNYVSVPTFHGDSMWRSARAEVNFGDGVIFQVGSEGFGVWILRLGDEWGKRRRYDNVIQAWLAMMNEPLVEKPAELGWKSGKTKAKAKSLELFR